MQAFLQFLQGLLLQRQRVVLLVNHHLLLFLLVGQIVDLLLQMPVFDVDFAVRLVDYFLKSLLLHEKHLVRNLHFLLHFVEDLRV